MSPVSQVYNSGPWLPPRTPTPMLHFHYSDKSGYKYSSLSLRIFNEWGTYDHNTSWPLVMVDLAIPAGRHHSSTRTPKCARTMCRNGRLENQATNKDSLSETREGSLPFFFVIEGHVARYPCLLAFYPCTSLSKLTISMLIPNYK